MTEYDVNQLLERAVGDVSVGPPPIDAMVGAATARRRRRRGVQFGLVAAVVAGAIVGTAVLTPSDGIRSTPQPGTPAPNPDGPSVLPAGMRWVGYGNVATAVPEGWGTNETWCGTPQADTVVVDEYFILLCLRQRPERVESVKISTGLSGVFKSDREYAIDGLRAQRQDTTCTELPYLVAPPLFSCSGMVHLPSVGVYFLAESSTGRAEVDAVLDRIRVLPDLVAVPEVAQLNHDAINDHAPGTHADEWYLERLEDVGLKGVITREQAKLTSHYVLRTEPEVGTMVKPGTTVRIVSALS